MGTIIEDILKNTYKKKGLFPGVIDKIHEDHISFYLFYKDKMDITLNEDGKLDYLFHDKKFISNFLKDNKDLVKSFVNGHIILNEEGIENYLSRVRFGYKFINEDTDIMCYGLA